MKKTKIYCDICETENPEREGAEIQVIFTTDQTEGRSCEPHLSKERIDICAICFGKVLQGNYIFAHGAQGHNTYYFKEEKKK